MICVKLLLFCFIFAHIRGQALDFSTMFGDLFPNMPLPRRNPQVNYPSTVAQYPLNGGQFNNPRGNIWNNENRNPGINYPSNSQYYPGHAVQGWQRPTGNENTWNNPGLPVNQVQGTYPRTWLNQGKNNPQTQTAYPNGQLIQQGNQPQYPASRRNVWNGIGNNINSKYPNMQYYPQNGLLAAGAYTSQENNVKTPNYYQSGNGNPTENDNVQKLNPNYPTARDNWNNGAVNPRVNYPGSPQPYPVNGIQTDVSNWNSGNQYQSPSQEGYQNSKNQNMPTNTFSSGKYPQTGYPSLDNSYAGFRSEVSQYPNQSEQADGAVTTEKAAILGYPVIISELKPSSIPKSEEADVSAQTKCVQDCSTSSDYQPICGTDNITYFNEEKFECAQKCGAEVAMQKRGACDEE